VEKLSRDLLIELFTYDEGREAYLEAKEKLHIIEEVL